jgi:hypothetical protein
MQVRAIVRRLRLGQCELADTALLEQATASSVVAELSSSYPLVFQERVIGSKREVGLARTLRFEVDVSRTPDSRIPVVYLRPALVGCVFVSSYSGVVSEITVVNGLRVRPRGEGSAEVILRVGRGHKLDRTPDGWAVKSVERRTIVLAEETLAKRGWKFHALFPLAAPRTDLTP